MKKLDRRDFIKKSTLTAAAIGSTPILSSCVYSDPSKKTLRTTRGLKHN
jgi:hypothetical protein